jgi:RNA polymerase-binding transcription factor DksA
MRWQLKDRELRKRVWPDYTFGCKRVLFSSHYLPALQRRNVEVVTDAIVRVAPEGIVTADGTLHELDCIIWATGFKTTDFMFPMQISGSRGVDLNQTWAGGAHAHLGMTVAGFPNMFVMYGPNTNTSGGSIIFYLETQAAYLRQALEQLRERDAGAIEVRPEIEAASDRAPLTAGLSARLHNDSMDPARARELLARERERIEHALTDLSPAAVGDDDPDPFESADVAPDLLDAEIAEGLRERLQEELAAVERAERRLAEGTYGLSVESGEPIPDARLEAIPWAERTAEEQARFESYGG